MKFALLVAALVFQGHFASAECVEAEPLCHSMHSMMTAMMCLAGQAKAPITCDTDAGETVVLKAASKDARVALEAIPDVAKDPAVFSAVDVTFNRLDAAIDKLAAAVAAGDAPAKAAALIEINAVKKQGHLDFKN